jgi:Ca2+-binding RTX toxin-like protein
MGGNGTGVTLKIVHGGNGDDTIAQGTVRDGSGNLINSAALGNTRIEGGGGNDFIVAGDGDDIILGQGGDDTLVGCGGRNYVHGGSGDDLITAAVFPVCSAPDDVVGTILCGGDDDDQLVGAGPSHQCMDGGAGTNTCQYVFGAGGRSATAFDVGTMRNCTPATDTNESCGCEEQTLPSN